MSDIDFPHFVAYAVFLAASFTRVQARRNRSRAATTLGMVGFVAAFWLMLRMWFGRFFDGLTALILGFANRIITLIIAVMLRVVSG